MEELIFRIGLAAGAIFSRTARIARIDPVENSIVAALGNTHDLRAILEELDFNITLFSN